jgi:dienelactone hydrolase
MVNRAEISARARKLTALVALIAGIPSAIAAQGNQQVSAPQTVVVQTGTLELRALLWTPAGRGPFPAVLFNHGTGPAASSLGTERRRLGSVFASQGYVFLHLFRRGTGLSADQGTNTFDVMSRAAMAGGQEARNREQMLALEGNDLSDIGAGLSYLRGLSIVDTKRIAVVGHSMGGSLTLVVAERDSAIRAAVVFGAAAGSWTGSAPLRARLTSAVEHARAPIFFVTASNDYSTAPVTMLGAAMDRRSKPHDVRIYPPFGNSSEVGHDLVYSGVKVWERDVFSFLAEHLRPVRH